LTSTRSARSPGATRPRSSRPKRRPGGGRGGQRLGRAEAGLDQEIQFAVVADAVRGRVVPPVPSVPASSGTRDGTNARRVGGVEVRTPQRSIRLQSMGGLRSRSANTPVGVGPKRGSCARSNSGGRVAHPGQGRQRRDHDAARAATARSVPGRRVRPTAGGPGCRRRQAMACDVALRVQCAPRCADLVRAPPRPNAATVSSDMVGMACRPRCRPR